ncbi:MAG TPA: hypothetical protein VMF89_00320, partial [Polyangiales bacterium]|nr:hypothetical protein [Polyangiales bacterium]
ADEQAPPADEALHSTKRRILVVDDNEDAAEMLAVLLQQGGYGEGRGSTFVVQLPWLTAEPGEPGELLEPASPRVLIVEDEFLIARSLQTLLQQEGARVLGPVARVADALELIATEPHIDCALLDVRLAAEPVFPVADALLARGVRVALTSGYDRRELPTAYRDMTYFNKLEDSKVLLRWVRGE